MSQSGIAPPVGAPRSEDQPVQDIPDPRPVRDTAADATYDDFYTCTITLSYFLGPYDWGTTWGTHSMSGGGICVLADNNSGTEWDDGNDDTGSFGITIEGSGNFGAFGDFSTYPCGIHHLWSDATIYTQDGNIRAPRFDFLVAEGVGIADNTDAYQNTGPGSEEYDLGGSKLVTNQSSISCPDRLLRAGGEITLGGRDGFPARVEPGEDAPEAHEDSTGDALGRRDNPVCASDHRIQVLYSSAPGANPDLDTRRARANEAREVVREMNWRLRADALASTNETRSAQYRVRCNSDGRISVVHYKTRETGKDPGNLNFDDIRDSARESPNYHTAPDTKYLIFYDGYPSGASQTPTRLAVGRADTPAVDDRLVADNAANGGTWYGAVYDPPGDPPDDGDPDTPAPLRWSSTAAMHENGHNMGAVQLSAFNATQRNHCIDGHDVMCYKDESARGPAYHETACPHGPKYLRKPFDCNNDDYFNLIPAPGSYLATHWNLGWSGNRFLHFSP